MPAGFVLLFFLACCLLFFMPAPALAQHACQHIKAGYSHYPPFSYQTPQGPEAGASVEVAKRTFAQMNVNVEMVQMPWARLLQETKDSNVDFIPAAYRTEQRQSWASYSDIPIGYERIVATHAQTLSQPNILVDRFGTISHWNFPNRSGKLRSRSDFTFITVTAS